MLQNNKLRIMRLFFDNPGDSFQLRQISRLAKIAVTSVTAYVNALVKEDFILLVKKGIYPSYRANRDNERFRLCKKLDLIERIESSGLLGYLYDSCMPDCIILFGSASLGEDIEGSDIDIFIQSKEKKLNLDKYEKIFSRKISLFFEENFSRLSAELKNNILNGLKLRGYIKVF